MVRTSCPLPARMCSTFTGRSSPRTDWSMPHISGPALLPQEARGRVPITTLGRSGSEVMLEALPAAGAAQQDAGKHGQDAPPDGGQARPGRRAGAAGGGATGRGGGAPFFSPNPRVMRKGEGEPAQERVVVQAAPGAAALEVVEA